MELKNEGQAKQRLCPIKSHHMVTETGRLIIRRLWQLRFTDHPETIKSPPSQGICAGLGRGRAGHAVMVAIIFGVSLPSLAFDLATTSML